jgi:hypothetical protein
MASAGVRVDVYQGSQSPETLAGSERRGAFTRRSDRGMGSCRLTTAKQQPNNRLHPTACAGELRRAGDFNLAPAAGEAER